MARSRVVSFFDGDHESQIAEVAEALSRVQKRGGAQRMAVDPEVEALSERYSTLKESALDSAKHVTLTAVSRSKWKALRAKYPPRTEGVSEDVQKADASYGVNLEAIEDDLLYASVAEPAFTSRAQFDEWADDALSAAEFGTLVRVAFELIVTAPDPKSLPALPTLSSAGTSDSPASTA